MTKTRRNEAMNYGTRDAFSEFLYLSRPKKVFHLDPKQIFGETNESEHMFWMLEDRFWRMIYAWRLHWSWIMDEKVEKLVNFIWVQFYLQVEVCLSRYKYERLRFTKILGLSLNDCARREKNPRNDEAIAW
jgi:hypothetical protein